MAKQKKNQFDDGFGAKLELSKVADMCRMKCTDYLGSSKDVVVFMLSENDIDKVVEVLQKFKEKNF